MSPSAAARALACTSILVIASCGGDGDAGTARPPAEDSPPEATSSRGKILVGFGDTSSSWQATDNPRADGWGTEAFNAAAGAQLNLLGEWLLTSGGDFPAGVTAGQVVLALPAEARLLVRDDATFLVERRSPGPVPAARARSEIADVLREEWRWLSDADDARSKFKVHGVEIAAGGARVESKVSASFAALVEGRRRGENSTWRVGWTQTTPDSPPQIDRIIVERWESAEALDGTLFSDCTASVLGGIDCWESQLLRGLNYWLQRQPYRPPSGLFGTPGIAVGDVDGNGLDDLYLCQENGLPNRLFLQQADGTALEVAAEWGVDWIEDSRAALLVDLDNDGDQDLVVSTLGNVVVARNDGTGFKLRTVLAASENLMSLSAADFDSDGRIDIFVCGYEPDELLQEKQGQLAVSAGPFVYYDSNNGAPNSLFRNRIEGDHWRFEDVTGSVGLDENNRRWSYAASWEDYDNDGDQDLYVANDFGRNNLYRNDPGPEPGSRRFTDIAAEAGVEDSASGMSAAWGDYDRDGLMDLHVGNMWSSAGRRIVAQQTFKPEIGSELRDTFKRFARGNTLMRQTAGGRFEDVSETTGITMGRWAWSAPFIDLDNDGWEDLVVANGYITGSAGSGDL